MRASIRAVYKSGTGTRGQGHGHGDACVGTWGRETRDLGTSSMGHGDAGTSKTGMQGTRDVNEYRKSRRQMRYLFLRENVFFMVNIRFHLPKPPWTPYDVTENISLQ